LVQCSGTAENKKLQDLLPGIINQLGSDNLEHLKTIAGAFQVSLSLARSLARSPAPFCVTWAAGAERRLWS